MAEFADRKPVVKSAAGMVADSKPPLRRAILPVLCAGLAICAAVANRAVPRLSTAALLPTPIASFPHAVGGWVGGPDRNGNTPLLKSATIIERTYQNPQGQQIALMLLTARDYADFHDPNICLPAQGFTLGAIHKVPLGSTGESAFVMRATLRQQKIDVLYWWPGQARLETGYGYDQWGKLLAARDRLTGEQGKSLFVRMMVPADDRSEQMLVSAATAWEPALVSLRQKEKQSEKQSKKQAGAVN